MPAKKKVLLIQPSAPMGAAGSYLVHEPLNLIALGTAVRDWTGGRVRILDFQVTPFTGPALFSLLDDFCPDLVGITAMTSQIKSAGKIASLIKEHAPKTYIVAGGQHPAALPRQTLEEFGGFDAVCIGEGERAFAALAKGEPPEKVKGLMIRVRGEIVSTGLDNQVENLDDLPIPDRSLVDRKLYEKGPVVLGVDRSFARPITVNLSRGCPFSCDFCSANLVYGKKVRFRSLSNIRREVEDCKSRYKINHVSINDGLFTYDRDFAISVGECFFDLGLTWDCRARADDMDFEFAEVLARLGCVKVFMGAEAGSQRVLDAIGKQLTVEQLVRAFDATKKAGIVRGTQFIIGAHPSQTLEEVNESLELAKRLDPEYCSFSIIMPLPGTPAYKKFIQGGLILTEDWDAYHFYGAMPAWRTEHFSPEMLIRLQKRCMLKFYLRPLFLARRLIRETKAGRLGYQLKSAMTLARFAFERRK